MNRKTRRTTPEIEKLERIIEDASVPDSELDSSDRVVRAALEAFAELGYHGTTTRDIAARADLSPAGLYVHYKSKADLLFVIIRMAHLKVLHDMQDALDPESDLATQLKNVIRAHVSFHATHRLAARVANRELLALSADRRRQTLKLRSRIESLVADLIDTGIKASVFDASNVKMASFALLSLGMSVSRWFDPDGPLSSAAVGDIYADMIIRMLDAGRKEATEPSLRISSAGEPRKTQVRAAKTRGV